MSAFIVLSCHCLFLLNIFPLSTVFVSSTEASVCTEVQLKSVERVLKLQRNPVVNCVSSLIATPPLNTKVKHRKLLLRVDVYLFIIIVVIF